MAQKLGSNWFQKVPNCTKKGVKTEDFTPKIVKNERFDDEEMLKISKNRANLNDLPDFGAAGRT